MDRRVEESLQPARLAAAKYLAANQALDDAAWWGLRMSTALNLFLWHLNAFSGQTDPVPLFVGVFDRATQLLRAASDGGLCQNQFPPRPRRDQERDDQEKFVSSLFSDVWVGMDDRVYFEESYSFLRERLEKNGVDPAGLFQDKVVLDAGCGSGKFSAAIARLGASRVIGIDLGKKGLDFAVSQAARVPYGDRLQYRMGNLLDLPLPDASVDMVWSNGVVHHTLDYEGCFREFSRVLKPDGTLFVYVNGRFGLFELLLDTLRQALQDVPRQLAQHFLIQLGMNPGRIYWTMDCLFAPYQWKSRDEVVAIMRRNGFAQITQLTRGVAIDQIEQVSAGLPFAELKYGEAQLKFLAVKKTAAN